MRAEASKWCADGVFTKVNVSSDGKTFVGSMQFSEAGLLGYQQNRFAVLNRLRSLSDDMARIADMNSAFSLHGPDGQMVGGCARRRSAKESACN
jgi:hypothetical protein